MSFSGPPWRPDSPTELPDGTLVCGLHGNIICGYCCCDYSFIQEEGLTTDSDEDDESYDENSDLESVTPDAVPGILDVKAFVPPTADATPQDLFPPGYGRMNLLGVSNVSRQHYRYVRRSSTEREILIYTDGACLNNGQANPAASCAFVFHPPGEPHPRGGRPGVVEFRLEAKGPTGMPYTQTSNRAELRAVIAALEFRFWGGEGWNRIVIATDSEYVVLGITEWVHGWVRRDWVTRQGTPVKNRDLWEALLGR